MFTVVPTTGPQDPATEDLVHTLRDTVLPSATAGTGLDVHVGGVTATSIDSTQNIAKRIPLLIGGVVLLSMLLLLVSFRSVAVALKAAAMNLLSVAAAYGVVALVLQGGWAGRLVGIDTVTPLPAFVPVLMFAVLFGLSMDYEVFLVSRMREAWLRTGNNDRAILEGLAGTGRVITAAAAIMVAVFAAFIPSADVVLKVIGVGMASAILIDATIVRMLLVPSVMYLLGRANWWLPSWLGRFLPQLHIEGRPRCTCRPSAPASGRRWRPAEARTGQLRSAATRSAAARARRRISWRASSYPGSGRSGGDVVVAVDPGQVAEAELRGPLEGGQPAVAARRRRPSRTRVVGDGRAEVEHLDQRPGAVVPVQPRLAELGALPPGTGPEGHGLHGEHAARVDGGTVLPRHQVAGRRPVAAHPVHEQQQGRRLGVAPG